MCLGIAVYAVWYTSAGLFPTFPPVDNAYIDLGESFLHGQLSLLEKPNPQLTDLQNPYDPMQRNVLYRWDFSFYKGKYYLYWGPVPALAFAAIEGATHIHPPGSLIILICYIGLSFIFLATLFQVWKYSYPWEPSASLALFTMMGLVNLPFLFLLGRPVIYETSIIAGQFFLWIGLLAWTMYNMNTEKPGWLIMAGLGWGLAIGCRYNLAISVITYAALALTQIIRAARANEIWKKIVLLMSPLALCVLGLGIYNFMRFDNPFETGLNYQLTLPDPKSQYYSISYLPSNLLAYLFYPLTTANSFPFILSTLPFGKSFDELTAGLFSSVPSVWLLVLAIPVLLVKKMRMGISKDNAEFGSLKFLNTMIIISGIAQFLFLMIFFYGAMRYIADFYLPLTFGILILVWQTDGFLRPIIALRVIFWAIVVGLILWSAGIGFFGGFDIPPQAFRMANPILYIHLASHWNHFYSSIISLFH